MAASGLDPPERPRSSVSIYRLLLRIYPRDFRDAYADEMAQAFRDMSRDWEESPMAFWAHVVHDTLVSGLAERRDKMNRQTLGVLAAAAAVGVAIAWVDSRPNWDDTGISAGALLLSSAVFGAAAPRTPWLWALAVGLWIPLFGILRDHNYSVILVLAFTFAGAYIGAGLRRLFAPPDAPQGDRG